jgi:hypothetical protein
VRWRWAAVLAVLLVPLGAGVAAAHGEVAQEQAVDLPVIRSIEPAVPGLAVTVIEGGGRLRLDNATPSAVQVMDGPVVESGGSVAWSDPRLDAVVWQLPLLVGDAPATVHGERVKPADPSPAPWWALTLAAALGTFSLGGAVALNRRDAGVTLNRRDAGAALNRRRGLDAALAAVLATAVTAHVVHVVGAALVLAEPPSPGTVLGAAGIGVGAWLLGLVGVGLILAGQSLGPACAAAAGGVLALLTAFDTTGFHRAVLVYGWSFDLDRATTAIAFGGGVGLVLAGWALMSGRPEPVTAAAAS